MTTLIGRTEPAAPPAPAADLIPPDRLDTVAAPKKPSPPAEILPMLIDSPAWPRIFPGL